MADSFYQQWSEALAEARRQGFGGLARAQQGGQFGGLHGPGLQNPYGVPGQLQIDADRRHGDLMAAIAGLDALVSTLVGRIAALEAALNPSAPNKDAPLLRAIKR